MGGLREALTGIYQAHGKLTPLIVLDEARPEDHELHDEFEWDDEVAGEKYRLGQARELIRSVRVTYREGTETEGPRTYRAWSSLPAEDGRAYLPTEEAIEDPFQRKLLVQEMRRELRAVQEKYGHLQEFVEVVEQLRHTA